MTWKDCPSEWLPGKKLPSLGLFPNFVLIRFEKSSFAFFYEAKYTIEKTKVEILF